MSSQIFADAVSNIFVANGLVRFQLLASEVDAEGQVKPALVETVVLPLSGFINLHAQMEQIIKKMIDDGLLKPTDDDTRSPTLEVTPKKK
jgi:hypothetical protein